MKRIIRDIIILDLLIVIIAIPVITYFGIWDFSRMIVFNVLIAIFAIAILIASIKVIRGLKRFEAEKNQKI